MATRKLLLVLLSLFVSTTIMAQVAVKTNLPLDALRIPNVGLEFGIGKKWTVDIPVYYNPWMYKNNNGCVEGETYLEEVSKKRKDIQVFGK